MIEISLKNYDTINSTANTTLKVNRCDTLVSLGFYNSLQELQILITSKMVHFILLLLFLICLYLIFRNSTIQLMMDKIPEEIETISISNLVRILTKKKAAERAPKYVIG
jgi:hypothetical protein